MLLRSAEGRNRVLQLFGIPEMSYSSLQPAASVVMAIEGHDVLEDEGEVGFAEAHLEEPLVPERERVELGAGAHGEPLWCHHSSRALATA